MILDKIIPSKNVREYLLENYFSFKNTELCIIIKNHEILTAKEKKEFLQELIKASNKEECEIIQSIINSQHPDSYVNIPYPFRHGDIVKNLINNEIGVVLGIDDDYIEKYFQCAKTGDYSDVQIGIVPYIEEANFEQMYDSHHHVNPIYLDYAHLDNYEVKNILNTLIKDYEQGE